MTLPSTPRRAGPFNGNGSATSFAFTFKVFAEEDIRVVIADVDGVESTLMLNSDYSVTLNGDQVANPGGSITYPLSGDPLATGETLTAAGALEYDQPADIPDGGNFNPTALENELDRIVMQVQQLAEENDRSVRLPVSVDGVSVELPVPEANELLVWNADATALTNKSVSELATAVAYANWRTSLFNGNGSTTAFVLDIDPVNINNLDVVVSGVPQRPVEDYTLTGATLTFSTAPPSGTKNVMVRYGEAVPAGTLDASGVTYTAPAGGAGTRDVEAKLYETRVSVTDFAPAGVDIGDNDYDAYTAISTADAVVRALGGGTVFFPRPSVKYKVTQTLTSRDGVRWEGEGAPNRWRAAQAPVVVRYTGSGAAFKLEAGVDEGIDSFQLKGLQFDGVDSAASCHGFHLKATASGAYIEGLLVENSAFINFPGNQILHDGVVFDITYRRLTAQNPNRAALDCVRITNTALADGPSQITFDDCWIAPYTAGKWSILAEICQDLRLLGGTLAPYVTGTVGANGVQCNGGLTILGTHIEGTDPLNTDAIGVQYKGSNGGIVAPSGLSLFGQGIVVGDGTADAARGLTIGGSIGNNNTADIVITNGGTRVCTILEIGYANSAPTILDNRRDVDGVYEVVNLRDGMMSNVVVRAAPGTDTAPGLAFATASTRGFYDTGTSIGVATGGGKQAEFTGTDLRLRTRLLPGTPAGVIQTAAGIYGGTGAPSNADGGNGEFYLRSDGGASTTIYQKRAGSWVGIV